MRVVPSTCDDSINARCEMDLSPGTLTSPFKPLNWLERREYLLGRGEANLGLPLLLLLFLFVIFITGFLAVPGVVFLC